MNNKPFCPMKFSTGGGNPADLYCDGEDCAWFVDTSETLPRFKGCAIPTIASALIRTGERTTDMLDGINMGIMSVYGAMPYKGDSE